MTWRYFSYLSMFDISLQIINSPGRRTVSFYFLFVSLAPSIKWYIVEMQ